ncbi:hypothetical protein [Bartonella sp. DGB2]|uniref:hypothetical protein n=1 Tax=Bartonella sp. DGB2 TaxID=3388426 RepID=UPI0039902E29
MYYAVVKEGVVINTIVAPENYTYPFDDGEAIPSEEAGIGWTYKDGQFTPPTPTEELAKEPKEDLKEELLVEPKEPTEEPKVDQVS